MGVLPLGGSANVESFRVCTGEGGNARGSLMLGAQGVNFFSSRV